MGLLTAARPGLVGVGGIAEFRIDFTACTGCNTLVHRAIGTTGQGSRDTIGVDLIQPGDPNNLIESPGLDASQQLFFSLFQALALSADFEEFTIGIRGKTNHEELLGSGNAWQIAAN
jgi:hypothetical protein